MAEIDPPPRSYAQLYGEMSDTFLSRSALPEIKIASPVDALFTAWAQSGARSTQGSFAALAARTLAAAKGADLDAIGELRGIRRQKDTAASGSVTVTDQTFVKVATSLYQGSPAPVVGSTTIEVSDASSFAATGSVYIGRGTKNYEGPIAYTAKTDLGGRWSLSLASPTVAFHNLGESVVFARGGNRTVRAGAVVQTAQGPDAVRFSVRYDSVLPDGEDTLVGVQVLAQKRGVTGNIPRGAITSFSVAPFAGAAVTNPQSFGNALPAWNDETYRDQLRSAFARYAKATDLAIKTNVVGVTAADEATTARSASVVHSGPETTLYVDDGTGYEEKSSGVPFEALTDAALGGEADFGLLSVPVAKAAVASNRGPFTISAGATISVMVGGVLYTHAFSDADFRDPAAAEPQEVAASVNANSTLGFAARTSEGRTRVVFVAKSETDDDVEVVETQSPLLDANDSLQFSLGRHTTLRLYRNNAELVKDGRSASLVSNPQSSWATATGSQTLVLAVDGTGSVTYTFVDSDFVPFGYSTLASSNSLASWAAVLNTKVPGITAAVAGDSLSVLSNLGASARAAVSISGGTLAGPVGMFATSEVVGRARDYVLDRNTGEVHLLESLADGDTLTAGSADPRAAVIGVDVGTVDLTADSDAWFAVDAAAEKIASGLTPSSTVTVAEYVATPPVSWGKRVRVSSSGSPFDSLQVGDWAIHLDTHFDPSNRGAWRIAFVDSGGAYYEIERSSFVAESGIAMSGGGIVFVRAREPLQRSTAVAGNNYTASSLADALSEGLRGIDVATYRTTRLAARTDTFAPSGDLLVAATDTDLFGLPTGELAQNGVEHRASVIAASPEDGTPQFDASTFVDSVSGTSLTLDTAFDWNAGHIARWRRSLPDTDSSAPRSRFGPNLAFTTPLLSVTGDVVVTRREALQEYLPSDRVIPMSPYAFGPDDDLSVVVDRDIDTKRYSSKLFRRMLPTTGTYGTTNSFTDTDGGGASLAAAFGLDYEFSDYAVLMRARAKSHSELGDTTKTILWRYSRFGASGNAAIVRYVYPSAPSRGVAVSANPDVSGVDVGFAQNVIVEVALPSGATRTGISVRNSTKIGVMAATGAGSGLQTLTFVWGFAISSANRSVVLNYTGRGAAAFTGTVTGGTSGATGTFVSDSLPGGSTGPGTLRLSAVTGIFVAGETITGTTGSATSSGNQVGETTLNIDVGATGATDHGIAPGSVIWVQGSGAFATGAFVVDSVSSGNVRYIEGTGSAPAASNVGTVSFDPAGEATLAGSTVASGDIFVVGAASEVPAGYRVPVRASTLGDQFWSGTAEATNATGTTIIWYDLNDAATLSVFPVNSGANQAVQIAAAVNALAASQGQACPVTAVAVGNGTSATGQIALAGYEEFSGLLYGYQLADGENWVQSQVAPLIVVNNYTFTFKVPVTATLGTNSDWANEEVRLVPGTAANVVAHLASQATGGLGNSAEVLVADGGRRPQIASLTPGSAGAVQVLGGLANAASASVVGTASAADSGSSPAAYPIVTCPATEMRGIPGGAWVDVVNAVPAPRATFTSSTSLSTLDASGNFTLTGTQAWTFANAADALVNGFRWQVEIVGRYVAYKWDGVGSMPSLVGVREGDYVTVATGAYAISPQNTGTFRIVRVYPAERIFWIENARATEEIATASLWFLRDGSILPGDQIVIGTSVWGAENIGTWTVESISSSDEFSFKVDVSARATVPFTGPAALGASASLVQCYEGAPTKYTKQILSVSPNPSDSSLVDVKLDIGTGWETISSAFGSRLVALDKLAFSTLPTEGADGYARVTGLLGEVSRVLYGDPADPATYPGVASSGAKIAISGPFVRSAQVSLGLRLRTGALRTAVFEDVRHAVAETIARAGVGEAVALSAIVEAASSVNGVLSVVVLSPTYSSTNDLIAVAPKEKLLVLDQDRDISLSVVGS
jgi:hypothetical protein